MAPLNVERLNTRTKGWEQVSQVGVRTVTKPIQNFLPDGSCELFFIEGSGNNQMSRIKKTRVGARTIFGDIVGYDADALTTFKELRRGESVEIKVKQSLRSRPITIRLSQV